MSMSRVVWLVLAITFSTTGNAAVSVADDLTNIPVAAPIDTDSAGRGGDIASHSVVRLICVDQNSMGTGFLHKSGNIITADHVVRGCTGLEIILPTGARSTATITATDRDHDLALVKPGTQITEQALTIAPHNEFKIGTNVSTWGFPGGYFGLSPMLSVGYLAGKDAIRAPSGAVVQQWVVNAAFNAGNSGWPTHSH
jgi:S1-C subfamily serine protease